MKVLASTTVIALSLFLGAIPAGHCKQSRKEISARYHHFRSGWDMTREGCMGPPGSIIEITILHDGQVMSLPVPRVDSRLLVGYDRFVGFGNHHYEDCAAQTRIW